MAAATTTLHLQTVLGQIGLQINKYDVAETNGSNTALRGTADNILDIIDVVQGDANLVMAGGGNGNPGHIGGFSEMPGGLIGTVTKFQDSQVQTNFWASFLAEANTMSAKLLAVANGTAAATQDLITQINNYQNFGAQFNNAQGAVFQGRFDNELAAGALQSDSAMAIKALTGILNGDTGAALANDNVMLQASAGNFIGNAGDIGGNNVALGGATYVGSGTTFQTTTSVNGIAMGTACRQARTRTLPTARAVLRRPARQWRAAALPPAGPRRAGEMAWGPAVTRTIIALRRLQRRHRLQRPRPMPPQRPHPMSSGVDACVAMAHMWV